MIAGRQILVDDVRIRGVGQTRIRAEQNLPRSSDEPLSETVSVHFA